jgi:hypothetical protein
MMFTEKKSTHSSQIVCEMHVTRLLQTLSSLTAEHTNSSVGGGGHFQN